MKMYVKPNMSVIELQLKENIAAVPTTVYKGNTRDTAVANASKVSMALSQGGTGLTNSEYAIS